MRSHFLIVTWCCPSPQTTLRVICSHSPSHSVPGGGARPARLPSEPLCVLFPACSHLCPDVILPERLRRRAACPLCPRLPSPGWHFFRVFTAPWCSHIPGYSACPSRKPREEGFLCVAEPPVPTAVLGAHSRTQ